MRTTGGRNIIRNMQDLKDRAKQVSESLIKATALKIARDAKTTLQSSPADYSKIAQSISAQEETPIKWTVNVNELPMGAYVEFGTGTFVQIPQGWSETAMQFYVNGKGYLHAFPYLIPAYEAGKIQFQKDYKQALERLVLQYNRR